MARKLYQGIFTPVNPSKYVGDAGNIIFRSGWERTFMRKCDESPQIVKWNSEECVVPYFNPVKGKMSRYFVDFAMVVSTNSGELKKYLVEIKPFAETVPPIPGKRKTRALNEAVMTYAVNQAKWAAADIWARKNGMEFIVITEKQMKF